MACGEVRRILELLLELVGLEKDASRQTHIRDVRHSQISQILWCVSPCACSPRLGGNVMVVVETKLENLKKLTGVSEIEEILFEMGMELEGIQDSIARVEVTAERVDMLTPEGLARAIRAYAGNGSKEYEIKSSGFSVIVDKSVKDVRPFTACCLVSGLRWNSEMIKETMAAHDKINMNYGRGRRKAAIGVYPTDRIKYPIHYLAEEQKNIRFAPLGFEKELSAEEILKLHTKGKEYGHLLKENKKYPVFKDATGAIMSMPPIINSRSFGEVIEGTKNVFIEVSGAHKPTVSSVLSIVSSSLAERGGTIETMEVVYPEGKEITPKTAWQKAEITSSYVNRVFGLDLKSDKIASLLERMQYKAKANGEKIELLIPPYRSDILHPLDIVDDVGRAYGFSKMEPSYPKVPTIGGLLQIRKTARKVTDAMIGYGFQEIMTNVLTSKTDQFERMNIPEESCVEILNAKEGGINIARKWVLPELLKFLSNNLHRPFPQRIFEIGDVVSLGESETGAVDFKSLAAVISDSKAGYETISSPIASLLSSFGLKFFLSAREHPSFIRGRCASVTVNGKELGIAGELHPIVLERWGIENPCAGFEIALEKLFI